MKIRKPRISTALTGDPQAARAGGRRLRHFDAPLHSAAKSALLNAYMRRFGRKACVVAASGA